MIKPRIIAFYLPQYHPFKENDEWWGKGFTEWTNVTKAKPLFRGHYQPKLPSDLGFYDLRVPDVREEQARLAKEAGIEGFCYWHYWFEGHELMERPFWEMVQSGKPDFPFCIGWANETWKSKMWNKDGSLAVGTKILIEQTYSDEDDVLHFQKLLPVFNDKRYIRVDGMPLVFIHRGEHLPEKTITIWNRLAKENGLGGIHFVGRMHPLNNADINGTLQYLLNKGFNGVCIPKLGLEYNSSRISKYWSELISFFMHNGCRHVVDYGKEMSSHLDFDLYSNYSYYPTVYPNWDHSPRSGKSRLILINSTPEKFKNHLVKVLELIKHKPADRQIVFIKSWNEWGEGNYLEPDQKFGTGYIDALRAVLSTYKV